MPPEGAGPFKVTVPVDDIPPGTEIGLTVTLFTPGGVIVSGAFEKLPFKVAVRVADCCVDTGVVLTVKLADVAPLGIVTDPATVAALFVDDKVTTVPAVGAGLLR